MGLECEEMHKMVCGPKMDEIHEAVKGLTKTIKESNGKPSVLARLDSLEQPAPKKTIKRFSLGKGGIKTEGYDGMDVVRIIATLGILYLVAERHGLVSGLIAKVF